MRTKTNLHIPGIDVKLGDLARDVITGFEGIATTHSRHLTGCDTVWLTGKPRGDEQNSPQRSIDVMALEIVESNPMGIQALPKDVPAAG